MKTVRRFLGVVIVLIFGFIATLDMLHPGLPITHDGQDHVARIANFYQNLSEGTIIPRWGANLNYGYGHPVIEFLYPFPSYVASFFHFLGFSFVDSTKLVFALALIASGITMYFLGKKLWGEAAGVVMGVLYMYTPYRFVDLYVRGDIGEHMAFVFVPLCFLGLTLISEKQSAKHTVFTACMIALLILSHNAIALMFMPLILLYGVYLFWQTKWKKSVAISLGANVVLGFLLSGFFWFPALIEGQYTLRNIVTKGGYLKSFVSLAQLLYGKWDYGNSGLFTVQLGILSWFILLICTIWVFVYGRKNRKSIVPVGMFVLYTICAIFLMLSPSNFIWQHVMLLQNFQFPWRFLAIPVFTLSFLSGFCLSQLHKKYRIVISFLCIVGLLLLSRDYMHAKAYIQMPESFYTGVYAKTTDTGESSPIWSVRFMEHPYANPLEVISGNAQITTEKRTTTKHAYTVSSQGQSRLLENTIYFPGWKITVDGMQVPVQFQDPAYRGLMTFSIANGTHAVVVSYQESKYRFAGDILSLIGLTSVVYILLFPKLQRK